MQKMQSVLLLYAGVLLAIGIAIGDVLIYYGINTAATWIAAYTVYGEVSGFIGLSLVEITNFLRE